jgi:hypothetical protein
MNAESLALKSKEFQEELVQAKATFDRQFPWYPYRTLDNFIHLKLILGEFPLDTLAGAQCPSGDFPSQLNRLVREAVAA